MPALTSWRSAVVSRRGWARSMHAVSSPSARVFARTRCSSTSVDTRAVGKRAAKEVQPLLSGSAALDAPVVRTRGSERLVVAVDIDEVLGAFVTSLNAFCAKELGLHYTIEDYTSYHFASVWRCNPAEANERVHAFFQPEYFRQLQPLPGARSSLQRLQHVAELVVVTSRQHIIEEQTRAWLAEHYGGLFKAVRMGNHFALSGASRSKVDLCREVGASILVDDNPVYARECADAGIDVLHYNHCGMYPWAKSQDPHARITPVRSWLEVEVQINVRAAAATARVTS